MSGQGRLCQDCVHFQTLDDQNGECRASPPVAILKPGKAIPLFGFWPRISPKDWCSGWQSEEAERPRREKGPRR